MNQNDFLKLLLQLLGLIPQQSQNLSFLQYGPISYSGGTFHNRASDLISSFGASQGPLGGLLGSIANKILLGDAFQNGRSLGSYARTLYPANGTYPSAFQAALAQSLYTSQKAQNTATQQALREVWLTNYYRITGTPENKIADAVKNTNILSLPSIIQAAFDPSKIEQTLKWYSAGNAGFTNWALHNNAVSNPAEARQKVSVLQSALSQLIQDASVSQLFGAGRKYYRYDAQGKPIPGSEKITRDFGGYSAPAVSSLAAVLANQRDYYSGSDIKKSAESFAQAVSDIAKAISPLRDVFKQDMAATVDAIKTFTGRSLSSLSKTQLRSISQGVADTMRYTGLSTKQYSQVIKQANTRVLQTAKASPGAHWATIQGGLGVGNLGLLATVGAGPNGLQQNIYQHLVKTAFSSAQASASTQDMAMAYGLWSSKQAKDADISIQHFMQLTGGDLTEAFRLAGVTTRQQLLQGRGTRGYLEGLNNGSLAQVGFRGQYKQTLGLAAARVASMYNVNGSVLNKLVNKLQKDSQFAAQAFDSSTDQQLRSILLSAGFENGAQLDSAISAFHFMKNDSVFGRQLTTLAAGVGRLQQGLKFKKGQRDLRNKLAQLGSIGTSQYALISNMLFDPKDESRLKADQKTEILKILQGQLGLSTEQLKYLNKIAPGKLFDIALGNIDPAIIPKLSTLLKDPAKHKYQIRRAIYQTPQMRKFIDQQLQSKEATNGKANQPIDTALSNYRQVLAKDSVTQQQIKKAYGQVLSARATHTVLSSDAFNRLNQKQKEDLSTILADGVITDAQRKQYLQGDQNKPLAAAVEAWQRQRKRLQQSAQMPSDVQSLLKKFIEMFGQFLGIYKNRAGK